MDNSSNFDQPTQVSQGTPSIEVRKKTVRLNQSRSARSGSRISTRPGCTKSRKQLAKGQHRPAAKKGTLKKFQNMKIVRRMRNNASAARNAAPRCLRCVSKTKYMKKQSDLAKSMKKRVTFARRQK